MPPSETESMLSIFNIVVKSVPILAALATAVVSLWRNSGKNRLQPSSDEAVTAVPAWKRPGPSGWVLIVLAIATCVTGLYWGIKDLKDAASRAKENSALRTALQTTQDTLTQTKTTLTTQLAQSRQETIDAKNATVKATQDSEERLAKIAGVTLASLLSSVTEPSYGIVDINVRETIPQGQISLRNLSIAEGLASTYDDNWQYTFMFRSIFNSIKWTEPVPLNIEAMLAVRGGSQKTVSIKNV